MCLKLFLLTNITVTGLDTFDSCVVCAKSELDAQMIGPLGINTGATDDWCKPDEVIVSYLGNARPELEAGLIMHSFNAG